MYHLLVYFFTYACSIDVDECESEIANCSVNANCTDTFGSFECTCNHGFEGDGFNCTSNFPSQNFFWFSKHLMNLSYVCSDINECASDRLNTCDENANCTDTIGGYNCSCKPGYEGDGFNCTGCN